MFKKSAFIITLTLSGTCHASSYTVWGSEISIYAQSRSSSTAHMIEATNGIYNNGNHPWCGKRAYIDLEDKELFSAALAASTSKQKINFIYKDNAASKNIGGHGVSNCKVISIFH